MSYRRRSLMGRSSGYPIGTVFQFDYTGTQQKLQLYPGSYRLQCWGAKGGIYERNSGGKGGYSEGILTVKSNEYAYIYVGGAGGIGGDYIHSIGGYNGGGDGYKQGAGGGASDIRLNADSLYARVIVAGGGGGGYEEDYTPGGGGGITGSSSEGGWIGTGGTQTSAGTEDSKAYSYFNIDTASFGSGSGYRSLRYNASIAGGGGGWYGGGAGDGGAGGSGYIFTSESVQNYPEGCLLRPNQYLSKALTTTVNGGSIEDANGKVIITVIDPNTDTQPLKYEVYEGDYWERDSSLDIPGYEAYKSNIHQHEVWANLRVYIEGKGSIKIYIRSDAESTYDYVDVYDYDAESIIATTKGNQQSGTELKDYIPVVITNTSDEYSVFWVTYKKDSSTSVGSDSGYVLLPVDQKSQY